MILALRPLFLLVSYAFLFRISMVMLDCRVVSAMSSELFILDYDQLFVDYSCFDYAVDQLDSSFLHAQLAITLDILPLM